MKNRSKMILGLASMLGITAGVTAVSGFAWFTTQRTAEVSARNFKVGAAEGSLEITKHGNGVNVSDATNAYTVADNVCSLVPADGVLADVSSGNGTNFYKATVYDTGTKDSSDNTIYAVDQLKEETGATSVINTAQLVKVEWSLDVTNANETSALNVFISASNLFTKSTSAGETDYAAYYRLAIFEDTYSEGVVSASRLVFLYSNTDHLKFIQTSDFTNHNKAADAGRVICPLDGTGTLVAGTSCVTSTSVIRSNNDLTAGVPASATAGDQLLIKGLTGTKTLRFVVWCEGTATPEAAVVSTNSVDMACTLVGLTA